MTKIYKKLFTSVLQEKSLTVSKNGTITIAPDSGCDGLTKAVLTVDVGSTSGVYLPDIQAPSFAIRDIVVVDFDSDEAVLSITMVPINDSAVDVAIITEGE